MPAPAPRSINPTRTPRSAVRTVPCINTNKHLFRGNITEGEGGGGALVPPLSCVKVCSNAASTVDHPQLPERRRCVPFYVEDICECLSGKTILSPVGASSAKKAILASGQKLSSFARACSTLAMFATLATFRTFQARAGW